MRLEIASSCKSLRGRVTLEGMETHQMRTHSWLFPFPLGCGNKRPPVIVIFSEADQPTDGASVMILQGE